VTDSKLLRELGKAVCYPLLFMDWVMKRGPEHQENGLSWIKNRKHTDLHFTDDIALLGKTRACLQKHTSKVENEA